MKERLKKIAAFIAAHKIKVFIFLAYILSFFTGIKWMPMIIAIVLAIVFVYEEKIVNFVMKYKTIIIGHSIYTTFSWLYDNVLWWLVEVRFGFHGVVAMMIGAVLINFLILLYYRNKKVSWLGWDQGTASLKNKEKWLSHNYIRVCVAIVVILSIVMHISGQIPWQVIPATMAVAIAAVVFLTFMKFRIAEDIFALFVLSILEDSFVATAYLRHGRTDELNFKDIMLFFACSLVSISYWAIRNGIIVEGIIRPLTKV